MSLCRDFTTPEVEKVEAAEGVVISSGAADLASGPDHQRRLAMLTTELDERQRLEADRLALEEEELARVGRDDDAVLGQPAVAEVVLRLALEQRREHR